MKIIYTVTANCDPLPDENYMQLHGAELDEALEDVVANFLLDSGAGFTVEASARVEP